MNLRQRKPLQFVPPVPIPISIPFPLSNRAPFRVPVKDFKINPTEKDFYFWKQIFDFLPYPCLIYLVFKAPEKTEGGIDVLVPLFPIEMLISWNNIAKLDEFKNVLLSYNFRKSLASKVARLGTYSTMLWFQSNGLTINESVLVSAAQRGDVHLFASILNDIRGRMVYSLAIHACKGASEFGHVDILKYALHKSLLPPDSPNFMLKFMKKASRNGHLNILEWYYIEKGDLNVFRTHFSSLFHEAIEGNKMSVLVWMKSHLEKINGEGWEAFVRVSVLSHVSVAASFGNYQLVVWLIEQGFLWDNHSTEAAASGGNIEVLKFLRLLNSPWSEDVCINAARRGYLGLLQWAKDSGCPWPVSGMFPAAARSNNVLLYQWLFDQACPFEAEESFHIAVQFGNFELLKFARSKEFDYWSDALNRIIQEHAASRGDLETIQWARLETIKWQREREQLPAEQQEGFGVQSMLNPYEDVITNAAEKGHLHILEFLRLEIAASQDANFLKECDVLVIELAAANGHVAILDWALANCNWHIDAILREAIKNSQFKVLVWLKMQFPDMLKKKAENSILPLNVAAECGDIEVFKWLRNNGASWDVNTIACADNMDNDDIVDWAIKNRCPKGGYKREFKSLKQRKGRLELSPYRG